MQTYTSSSNGPSTAGGTSATDQARDKAEQAAGQAKQQAEQAAGQAKDAVRSQVDQRSTEAGRRVGGVASDVRSVGDHLRSEGKDQPAKLADQAAERADQLSRYLTDSDADRILRDVEEFGRRRPWAVIAGGIALGFAASRFLKASSSRRYDEQSEAARAQIPARTSSATPGVAADPMTTPGSISGGAPSPVTPERSF